MSSYGKYRVFCVKTQKKWCIITIINFKFFISQLIFIFILGQCKNQDMPFGEWRSTYILTTTFKEEEGCVILCFQQHSENFSEDYPNKVMFRYLCSEKECFPPHPACNVLIGIFSPLPVDPSLLIHSLFRVKTRKEMSWHLKELGIEVNEACPDHLLCKQSCKGKWS